MKYIWQCDSWPKLTWDSQTLLSLLGQARLAQGNLLGRVRRLGFRLGEEAQVDILTEEAVKTAAIEGDRLNPQMVRSSVARHLGLSVAGLVPATRSIDGLVEVILDATQDFSKALSARRLKGWHAALFPSGHSGIHKIRVGLWRGKEPMRIVSGPVGREKIHFEAPSGEIVEAQMRKFLSWWELSRKAADGILRAGLAHFYFVTIHPFEDGNGRIARALTDMALAQDENLNIRYYSLSSQIMEERDEYYNILERCSKNNTTDVTEWLIWFLGCFQRAIQRSDKIIGDVLAKADFWQEHAQTQLNERQKKIVNRVLETGRGKFVGGLTTRKYVSIAKVSRATAFREITDMLDKKVLRPLPGNGRSVHYDLVWPE
ncbi:MAG: Fic family protein [Candidatus Omnitrophica bacterium]|nr:Fic family protein [Candidatus Omnitrophota bacterium]